jgi:hypothetical protein
LQVKPQLVPLQVGVAFATAGHALHEAPHEFVLELLRHWPLQLCVPPGQTPLQAWPFGMQSLAQSLYPPGHTAPHAPPVQVALPPVGTEQGVHEAPHDEIELLSAHTVPLHRW